MVEIWKTIPHTKKKYKASSCGRIRSIKNNIILSPSYSFDGYLKVCVVFKSKKQAIGAHRLIAYAFHKYRSNKPEVNHINGLRDDNRPINLEWVTKSQNILHSFRVLGRKSSNYNKYGSNNHSSIRIKCINTGMEYGSILEASRVLGIHDGNIGEVCKGKRKTAGGLSFKYT